MVLVRERASMAAKSPDPRKDRLAAALKENLKRRKAQARAKAVVKRISGIDETVGNAPHLGPKVASKPG
jgi:hypothetical protein